MVRRARRTWSRWFGTATIPLYVETARLNKAGGLGTTGAGGGLALSTLVELRAEAFATTGAANKENMVEVVRDNDGTTLCSLHRVVPSSSRTTSTSYICTW